MKSFPSPSLFPGASRHSPSFASRCPGALGESQVSSLSSTLYVPFTITPIGSVLPQSGAARTKTLSKLVLLGFF
jgi:hypothetical protein